MADLQARNPCQRGIKACHVQRIRNSRGIRGRHRHRRAVRKWAARLGRGQGSRSRHGVAARSGRVGRVRRHIPVGPGPPVQGPLGRWHLRDCGRIVRPRRRDSPLPAPPPDRRAHARGPRAASNLPVVVAPPAPATPAAAYRGAGAGTCDRTARLFMAPHGPRRRCRRGPNGRCRGGGWRGRNP